MKVAGNGVPVQVFLANTKPWDAQKSFYYSLNIDFA